MSDLTKFLIKAYLRKALTILGTYLLTHDLLATGTASDFASSYLDEVAGAVMLTGSTVWTTIYQWYVRRKVVAALAMPASTNREELEKATEQGVGSKS